MSKPGPTILETIYAQRAQDVEKAKGTPGTTPGDITTLLSLHLAPPLIPLVERLKRNPSTQTSLSSPDSFLSPSPSLMAEIKRASPSKGPIALTANAAQQAVTYALSGASVISVLTEPTWFKGTLLDMSLARKAIDFLPDRPAILRKDFILDEYQIAEARLHGADTVLLIVAMLSDERLEALYKYSLGLGMEPLVEVNNAAEMTRALALNAKVIGVNNRNLHDFQVDMGTTSRLVEMVQERDVILCALSGISTPADVVTYQKQGVRAVLIGEALMRAPDTGAFICDLLGWPKKPHIGLDPLMNKLPWVKVDGPIDTKEAMLFMAARADMIGLIFDPQSPKSISPEAGEKISKDLRGHRHASNSYTPVSPPPTSLIPPPSTPWFTTHVQRLLTSASARGPLLVGVFKDQPLDFIIRTVYTAQLDFVQLNGSEPNGWIPHIPVPVIRRFDLSDLSNPASQLQMKDVLRPGLHAFILLSGSKNTDWEAVKTLLGKGEARGWPVPVMNTVEMAGSLDVEGVVEWALEFVQTGTLEEFSRMIRSVKQLKA